MLETSREESKMNRNRAHNTVFLSGAARCSRSEVFSSDRRRSVGRSEVRPRACLENRTWSRGGGGGYRFRPFLFQLSRGPGQFAGV